MFNISDHHLVKPAFSSKGVYLAYFPWNRLAFLVKVLTVSAVMAAAADSRSDSTARSSCSLALIMMLMIMFRLILASIKIYHGGSNPAMEGTCERAYVSTHAAFCRERIRG